MPRPRTATSSPTARSPSLRRRQLPVGRALHRRELHARRAVARDRAAGRPPARARRQGAARLRRAVRADRRGRAGLSRAAAPLGLAVTYVRGVTISAADLAGDVATVDPMHLPAQSFAEGTTLAQLIALAERARAGGGSAVYLFHGIGGEHLRVSREVHQQFVDWLAAHRRDLWVATMQEALDWAKAHPGGRAAR
ncbi:hypothetical protein AB5I41_13180 [Sphingomonas sp. MMS24-JH45]